MHCVLLAVFALVLRLGVPMPMWMGGDDGVGSTTEALLGSPPICHSEPLSGGAPDHGRDDDPAGHEHDCGLCPICHVVAGSAVAPADAPAMAPPLMPRQQRHALLPPATGPPPVLRAAASPRGPPTLSV